MQQTPRRNPNAPDAVAKAVASASGHAVELNVLEIVGASPLELNEGEISIAGGGGRLIYTSIAALLQSAMHLPVRVLAR